MDATLDQVVADVTAETTLETSLITLLTGIQNQLTVALANEGISGAAQLQIDSIFAGLEANKAALTAALASGTPVAPVATAPVVAAPAA